MSLRHQTPHYSQQKFVEPKMLEMNLAKIFSSEVFSWRLRKHRVGRSKRLRGVRAEREEGWGSSTAFLRPALARILGPLSDTLLFLPQKVWIGCAEMRRARQGQDWKTLGEQAGGQSWCVCHLGSRELTWKSISCKPRGQIRWFYLQLLVSFLPIPPSRSRCLLVLLHCILIHYSSPAGLCAD